MESDRENITLPPCKRLRIFDDENDDLATTTTGQQNLLNHDDDHDHHSTLSDKERKKLLIASERASHALMIVLQYWMIPDLGWSINNCDIRQLEIQKDLCVRISNYYDKTAHTEAGIYRTLEALTYNREERLINAIEIPFDVDYVAGGIALEFSVIDLATLLPQHHIPVRLQFSTIENFLNFIIVGFRDLMRLLLVHSAI